MKLLLRFLALLLLALLLATALAIQTAPLLPLPAELSAAQVQQGRDFLRRNDPRRAGTGTTARRVDISESELNLLLGQVARHRPQTALDVRLQPGLAVLRASLALPMGLGTGWLNIDALLAQTAGLPEVERLRIGRLPVPAWAAQLLLQRALRQLQAHSEVRLASELVDRMAFGVQRLRIDYQWQTDSMERMLSGLWPAAEQQRARAYHEHLRGLAEGRQAGQAVSLAELLPPMFTLARKRSAEGGDSAAENRAALLTLALYASGKRWGELMPAARNWPPLNPLTVTLAGRDDFPQHLLISACLAIEGGGPLADAIGVYKEVADARSGSGFSFNDIAVDRAGTRLGLLATKAPARLQAALAGGVQERDFVPDVSDLPEFMREQDFVRRYGSFDAPAYRQMMADIEARLDGLPLLVRQGGE